MLGSAVLDTAVGLIFIFFVISTICSSVFSLISRLLEQRGKLLQQGLHHLLDEEVLSRLMTHPLVEGISLAGDTWFDRLVRHMSGCEAQALPDRSSKLVNKHCPAYIPPRVFSQAMLDIFIETARAKNLNVLYDHLAEAGFELLAREVREEVMTHIDQQLARSETTVKSTVQDVLDQISERQFVDVETREAILQTVDDIYDQRSDMLAQLEQGMEELNLPSYTVEFLKRNLDLLTRRRGLVMLDTAQNQAELMEARLEKFAGTLENWFNSTMDNLTTIFKARVQVWLFGIAVVVTLLFNLNTLTIADTLWTNPTVRETVVTAAEAEAQRDPGDDDRDPTAIFQEELVALDLPVGWSSQELDAVGLGFLGAQVDTPQRPVPDPFTNLIGWSMTVGAAIVGAPFWFDLLQKILQVRGDK